MAVNVPPKKVKARRKPSSKAKPSSAKSAKARAKRPTKAEQRAEMMEQILDVSEDLFSKHGLYGVTLERRGEADRRASHAHELLLPGQEEAVR